MYSEPANHQKSIIKYNLLKKYITTEEQNTTTGKKEGFDNLYYWSFYKESRNYKKLRLCS